MRSSSEDEPMCRICLDDDPKSDLISPCDCKGSMEYVHRCCLNDWYTSSFNKACGTCKAEMVPTWAGFKQFSSWGAALRLERIRRRPLHYMGFCLAFLHPIGVFKNYLSCLVYSSICSTIRSWFFDEKSELSLIYMTFYAHLGFFLGVLARYIFTTISTYDWSSKKKEKSSWNRQAANIILLNKVIYIFCDVVFILHPSFLFIFVTSFMNNFVG